jgi:ethanolaminephosphotransferase
MVLIPPEGFKHMEDHRYATTGYSWLDTHVMNYLWEAFVKSLPRSLAPNLITVIGLVFMITHYLVMLPYDLLSANPCPRPLLRDLRSVYVPDTRRC